jgi:hypothetical protein
MYAPLSRTVELKHAVPGLRAAPPEQ